MANQLIVEESRYSDNPRIRKAQEDLDDSLLAQCQATKDRVVEGKFVSQWELDLADQMIADITKKRTPVQTQK